MPLSKKHLILSILAMYAVAGCVPFPISVPEKKPFKDVSNGFFAVGKSTADNVISKLGEPAIREREWWLYRDTREGWQWAFCAGGAYSAGCGALPRSSSDYFFVVDFDEQNVITTFALYTENELCDERKICYEGEILMRAAALSRDTETKNFRVPPFGCTVFTYSRTDSDSAAGELIIDGEIVGGLVGTSGYYAHIIAPGPHAWVIVPSRVKHLPLSIARRGFECNGQQIAFLRYRSGMWGMKIDVVDTERGELDIRARWLAISEPEYDDMVRSNWLRNDEIYVTKQGTTITAYQLVESDKVPRWGLTNLGEPCGMRAALEDYGLSPLGEEHGLRFWESLSSQVQLRGVCDNETNCTFKSVLDGESCDVTPGTDIEFEPYSKLLVLEPDGESYTELYYGEAKSLKKRASCKDNLCRIEIDQLRDIN